MGQDYNPYLKGAILEVVANQLRDNEPPETRKTLNRLMKKGHGRKQAMEMIGSVVAIEIYEVLKAEKPFDRKRFITALNELE